MADTKPFFLRHHKQLVALERWLSKRKYNAYSVGMKDKRDNPMIGLKWDRRPHSDVATRMENAGLVIIIDHSIVEQVETMVEQYCR